jgi:hypothetical protein
MTDRTWPALAAALVTLASAACGGAAGDPPGPPPPPATTCPVAVAPATPTFSGHVLPMLRGSCGGADAATSCHGLQAPAGHVSYALSRSATQVWGDLVGAAPSNAPTGQGWLRVAAGDPDHSWIVEKVSQDYPGSHTAFGAFGARMPYAAPNLCDPTVQALRGWILRGAPND